MKTRDWLRVVPVLFVSVAVPAPVVAKTPKLVYLSDLEWVTATGVAEKIGKVPKRDLMLTMEHGPKEPRELPLRLGGREFPGYTVSEATITYYLNKKYVNLVTWVGISDAMKQPKGVPYEWGAAGAAPAVRPIEPRRRAPIGR